MREGVGEGSSISRVMYDNMARLVGEEEYPETWWQERQQCLATISPQLTDRRDISRLCSIKDPFCAWKPPLIGP